MQLTARDILAKTLQAEAGNQGPLGMLSVGSVIMNRLMSGSYPNKLHDVILQPGQFSAWNKTTGYADGLQGQDMNFTPNTSAYLVADQLLDENYNDPTGGATHFYNPAISNPAWGKTAGGNWKTIGDHVFGTPANKDTTMSTTFNNSPVIAATSNNPTSQQPMSGMNSNPLFKMLGNAVGGGFDQLKNAVTGRDPDAADRLAIGLMQLSGQPQQFAPLMQLAANDIQERKKLRQTNKTIEYIKQVDPELAKLVKNNPALMQQVLSQAMAKQLAGNKTVMSADQLKEKFNLTGIRPGAYNVVLDRDGKLVSYSATGQSERNIYKEKIEGGLAEKYLKMSENYSTAKRNLDTSRLLGEQLAEVNTGPLAQLQSWMAGFGVDTRDSFHASAEALISKMVPSQREPGSGPMSDADLDLYKLSLPKISNLPGGNALIVATMTAIAEYEMKVADIANSVIIGEMTPYDAIQAERALADPLDPVRQFMRQNNVSDPLLEEEDELSREEATEELS